MATLYALLLKDITDVANGERSSTVMVYDGRIINHCASVTGPRSIPTGFVVLPED